MGKDGLAFQCLSKEEQNGYIIFENAMLNYKRSVDVSSLRSKVDYVKIVNAVIGDNPQIIYLNKGNMMQTGILLSKQISFVGVKNKSEYIKMEQELTKTLEDVVFDIAKRTKNDIEIIEAISAYLQDNVTYDEQELNSISTRGKSINADSHNAYGALVKKLAVCDGFASAFSLIAKEFGFKSTSITGKSTLPGSRNSSQINHAWNIIEHNGNFYHVDCTWDNNICKTVGMRSHSYFLLDDSSILIDHDWDFEGAPKCNSKDFSYFQNNSLIAYNTQDLHDIFNRMIRLGKKEIEIQLFGGFNLNNVEVSLAEILNGCLSNQMGSWEVSYLYNDTTRTFLAKIHGI